MARRARAAFWLLVAVSVGWHLAFLCSVLERRMGGAPGPVLTTPRKEPPMPAPRHRQLKADASNRSLRTFLQGLGFAVLTAIVLVLYPVFTSAHSWADVHWSLLAFALVQAVGTAVLSYFMRVFVDPSAVPTPLPPANPGEPDNEAGVTRLGYVLLIVAAVIVVYLLAVWIF